MNVSSLQCSGVCYRHITLMNFSQLAALEVVVMTTSSTASDDKFINITMFPFQCQSSSQRTPLTEDTRWQPYSPCPPPLTCQLETHAVVNMPHIMSPSQRSGYDTMRDRRHYYVMLLCTYIGPVWYQVREEAAFKQRSSVTIKTFGLLPD